MLRIEWEKKENAILMRVAGRMDAAGAEEFDQACRDVREEAKHLILDFTELRYISSAGLRAVLVTAKALAGRGGSLRLAGLDGMVREVFDISGFTGLFALFPTAAEALRALSETQNITDDHIPNSGSADVN